MKKRFVAPVIRAEATLGRLTLVVGVSCTTCDGTVG